ncbi:hypothetical protein BO94DRAFT_619655 [Aspergillus sclerotioniger CBS 115572]|uniref:S-adenosyl-L-methionine-dependent methyltransferase n=1 Tax=Aspergillus sclerotioniger CBS 115572 TaxID=1450535 RepID=A0A317XD52_9EURO|nr:hypothetical protein BO94DRAFT_619655 [Aspergillus sclerotioniger CBS 115572]PWY96546.1 hypothetical protein BO94DRAFT_619655 [Aspergillus sclerotioniger CBS 115572]
MKDTSSVASYTQEGNAFAGTEGIYQLPHHQQELELDSNPHLRVLDASAADGTWLRSLAELYPNQTWSLHGVDIGSALFPPPSAEEPSIDLREMDIRKPVPEHLQWVEKFDIIHQRLLIWGLKSPEWPQTLSNLCSLLKPGGWMQLVERQWVDRDKHFDPVKFLTLAKMSKMQRWSTAAFKMNIYVAYELEGLLQDSGLLNITKLRSLWAMRFRSLSHKIPPDGIPGVAKTPAEFDAFLDDLRDEVFKNGYAPQLNIVIGQKPQNRFFCSRC